MAKKLYIITFLIAVFLLGCWIYDVYPRYETKWIVDSCELRKEHNGLRLIICENREEKVRIYR